MKKKKKKIKEYLIKPKTHIKNVYSRALGRSPNVDK